MNEKFAQFVESNCMIQPPMAIFQYDIFPAPQGAYFFSEENIAYSGIIFFDCAEQH